MKRLAYALPIAVLACSPALAQQDPEYRATTPTATDTSSVGGIQIPPYEPTRGPRAGAWETTLSGSGVSTDEFDSNLIGVSGSLGYYVTKWMPVGIRQNLNLSFGENLSDSVPWYYACFHRLPGPAWSLSALHRGCRWLSVWKTDRRKRGLRA